MFLNLIVHHAYLGPLPTDSHGSPQVLPKFFSGMNTMECVMSDDKVIILLCGKIPLKPFSL